MFVVLAQGSTVLAGEPSVLDKIKPLPHDSQFKFYEAGDPSTWFSVGVDLYINNREARFGGLNGTLLLEPQPALPEWVLHDERHEHLRGGALFKVTNTEEFSRQNPEYPCDVRWLVIAASKLKNWGGLGWYGSKERKNLNLYMRVAAFDAQDIASPSASYDGLCWTAPYLYFIPLSDYPLLRER